MSISGFFDDLGVKMSYKTSVSKTQMHEVCSSDREKPTKPEDSNHKSILSQREEINLPGPEVDRI